MPKRLLAIVIPLWLSLLAAGAQAIALTDVSFRDTGGEYVNAQAAALSTGGESAEALSALEGAFAGGAWSFLEITDDGGFATAYGDASFTLTGWVGSPAGEWHLRWSDLESPLAMDLVVVVKTTDQWGAYLLSDLAFGEGDGVIDGAFDVSWFAVGTSVPSFRSLSVYGRVLEAGATAGEEEAPPPEETPVPGTLLLLGLALLGLRILRA